MNDPTSPFSAGDQNRLAEMVRDGFHRWKSFHQKYGEKQKSIGLESPGTATWRDVNKFLADHAGATARDGFKIARFRNDGGSVRLVEEDADVIGLSTGNSYVCGDYAESLVYDPEGQITPKLGLNLPVVSEAIRRLAFPTLPVGAAWLRATTTRQEGDRSVGEPPYGVLSLLRLTLKQDSTGQWAEVGTTLHVYVVRDSGAQELVGSDKGAVIRRLLDATVRKSPEADCDIVQGMRSAEENLLNSLRKPSEEELRGGIRHAVVPLLAAIVTD